MPARTTFADDFQPDFGLLWKPKPREVVAAMAPEELQRYLQARKKADEYALKNPVGSGWILPSWKLVMDNWRKYPVIVILGGIRSSKSTLASRLLVWTAATIPEAECRAYHVNDERSVEQQQFIWEALPEGIKNLPTKKGIHHSIQYSQKNGFTDNICIVPPVIGYRKGGTIKFGNYAQYKQDAQVTEGFKSHAIWCIAEGELVQMANGALKPIQRVRAGERVLTLNGSGKPVLRKVIAAQYRGTKPCVTLQPRNGTPITCTPDHEIFWGYNFNSKALAEKATSIAQIRPGWWPSRTRDRSDAWYVWAGLVVSEGSIEQRKITSGDSKEVEKAIGLLPPEARVRKFEFAKRHRHVPDWYLYWDAFWEEFPSQRSETKEIPSWVFTSSREKAVLFLRWLYLGDGWANGHTIGYATTSYRLSTQLVVLLGRLGIRASVKLRKSRVPNWRDQYWVMVSKAVDVLFFIDSVGIEGKGEATDLVRAEAVRRIEALSRRGSHLNKTRTFNKYFSDRNIQTRLKSSRIVSKTDAGERPVYDLTIEGEHRFLCGTSLVSNCDEEVPVKMFETLVYRTTDYHGRIILTFTTLSGWTSLIQDILGKTKTLKTAYAPLLRQEVPVMQESLSRPGAVIYYFHTADNAFIDVADFTSKVKSRSKAEIAARAYGIPTKSLAGAFPLFSREVNVIPHEQLPWLKDKKYKVTRYMGLDPGGSKNWFMLWVAIDAAGTWWVYREWPDFDDWALPGNKPGPATKSLGYGIKDYVELIKDIEKDGAVYERVIDPRLGAAEKQAEEGATTIITQLDDQDMTFIPAPAASSDVNKGEIEDGIQLISDLLAYRQDKPRDAVNSPHLYVSDRCQNFIYAMQEYTGKLGTTEATKDPCDCFDAETEVLTEDGWAPFPTLERGKKVATMAKDGYLEFQTPTEYHDYEYSGPMISVKSESLDFKVTPNHRMLVYPQRPYLKIREAKNLYRQDTVPVTTLGIRDSLSHTVELWPGKIVSAEDWAEFMGWYVSEGSVDGSNGGNLNRPSMGVYISQSETANLEKFDLIGQVIGRLGFRGKPRATGWAIYNYDLWCLLAPLGAQSERYIPREVMNLPRNCLEKLWAAMVLGDGWRQGIYGHYASISTRLIEDTSELLSRLGRPYGGVYVRSMDVLGGEIKGRPVVPTMPLMMFGEKKRRVASLTTKTKEMLVKTEEYAGRVYCVSVPNETLLVRRNWKPLVAGNCLRYLRKANCMFLEEQPPDKGSTGVY